MAKVSIIMPAYNAAKYIAQAIESILNQTYKNFELLIFNDGSTDNTQEIIESYEDDRVRHFNYSNNSGYIKHLNYGLGVASGKYIARMDADDICVSSRLERQVDILERDSTIGLCCSNYQVMDEQGNITATPYFHSSKLPILWQLLWENPIAHPSVMIRTELLHNHGFNYNKEKYPAEDYDLWCSMALHTKYYRTDEVLIYYRVHSTSEFQKNMAAAFRNGLNSLDELVRQITGNATPKMHIQQTVFKDLVSEKETIEPDVYHKWLKALVNFLLENKHIENRDLGPINEHIKEKCDSLIKEYWLTIRKYSLKTMIKFYFSPALAFTKFKVPFQIRLIGKCLIGYSH